MNVNIERIQERITALKTNSSSICLKIGTHAGFLRDLYEQRKKTITVSMLRRLAQALDCDSAYLLNEQDEPRVRKKSTRVTLSGSIRADVWMSPTRDTNIGVVIDYPIQSIKEGVSFYWIKAFQNSFGEYEGIVRVENIKPSHNDLIVLERLKGEMIERSIRKLIVQKTGFKLENFDEKSTAEEILINDKMQCPKFTKILGVVTNVNIIFNRS